MTELLVSLESLGRAVPTWLGLVILWTGAAWLVARALDSLLRRWLAPRWRLPLYAMVLVRLVLPLDWQSPVGLLPDSTPAASTAPVALAPTSDVTATESVPRLIGSFSDPALAIVGELEAAPVLGWGLVVIAAWLLGSALLLGRLVAHGRWLRRITATSVPAPSSSLDPSVRVLVHPHVGPLAFGLRRPTVVLPRALVDGDPRALRLVLAHEQAHLARRDPAVAGLIALVVALAWPVLPLWLAARRARTLLELAADAHAVEALGGGWREYGRTMIELAASRSRGPALAVGLFGHVRERIAALRPRPHPRPLVQGLLGAGVPVAVLACAAVQEPEPPVLASPCEADAATLRSTSASEAEDHAAALQALVASYERARDAGEASATCRDATRDGLAAAATAWHDLAETTGDEWLRALAGTAYERFVALFPADPEAYAMRYYYAELLWSQAHYAHAAARLDDARVLFHHARREFVDVLDSDPRGRYYHDAAQAQLLATRGVVGEPEPPVPAEGTEPLDPLPYGSHAQALVDSYHRYFDSVPPPGANRGRAALEWARLAMQHNRFEQARMPLALAQGDLDADPGTRTLAVRAAEMELDVLTIAWTRREATPTAKAVAGVELSAFVDGLRLRPLWEHPDAARLREQAAILQDAVRGEQRPALAPP